MVILTGDICNTISLLDMFQLLTVMSIFLSLFLAIFSNDITSGQDGDGWSWNTPFKWPHYKPKRCRWHLLMLKIQYKVPQPPTLSQYQPRLSHLAAKLGSQLLWPQRTCFHCFTFQRCCALHHYIWYLASSFTMQSLRAWPWKPILSNLHRIIFVLT